MSDMTVSSPSAKYINVKMATKRNSETQEEIKDNNYGFPITAVFSYNFLRRFQ